MVQFLRSYSLCFSFMQPLSMELIMATLKVWTVTAYSSKVDAGMPEDVEAHTVTIEPSGALTFWASSPDGMLSFLWRAFAPSQWKSVTFKGLAEKAAQESLPGVNTGIGSR
jgi:hypothetical protein